MASHAGFNPSWTKKKCDEMADMRSFTLLRTVRVGLVARFSAGISVGLVLWMSSGPRYVQVGLKVSKIGEHFNMVFIRRPN